MFMKTKDLLVSKVVGDEVTDGQGYFIRELNKNFNINSISNLLKIYGKPPIEVQKTETLVL